MLETGAVETEEGKEEFRKLSKEIYDLLTEITKKEISSEFFQNYLAIMTPEEEKELKEIEDALLELESRISEILFNIRKLYGEYTKLKASEVFLRPLATVFEKHYMMWKLLPHMVALGFFSENEIMVIRRILGHSLYILAWGLISNNVDLIEFVVQNVFPHINMMVETSLSKGGFLVQVSLRAPWAPIERTIEMPPSIEDIARQVSQFMPSVPPQNVGEKEKKEER